MIQKETNNGRFHTRQLFTVVFTLFLLFSSCSTKRGVKALLNIPVSTTKTLDHTENNKIASLSNNCLSCDDLQVLTVDSSDTSLFKNLSPADINATAYTSFLNITFIEEPTEYSYSPPSILGEVPIYILFKKLILHNV